MGTHLNCIDDAIQMSTHNICLYEEVDKKYTGCNLKITELLDCALIGVCAVIRSNTVVNSVYGIYPKYSDRQVKANGIDSDQTSQSTDQALWRPWWLSWMRRLTGDQEVMGSTPAVVGNILSWRLIMKYFLWSFSPFR